jgi:hypothetical protein
MTKITAEHLARNAIVYVRQSSPHQVANNLESQRRQYALVARGLQLGWTDVQVSKGCWRASAKVVSALSSQLRPRGSRGMAEIGIRWWSSVDWLAR